MQHQHFIKLKLVYIVNILVEIFKLVLYTIHSPSTILCNSFCSGYQLLVPICLALESRKKWLTFPSIFVFIKFTQTSKNLFQSKAMMLPKSSCPEMYILSTNKEHTQAKVEQHASISASATEYVWNVMENRPVSKTLMSKSQKLSFKGIVVISLFISR